MPKRYIVDAGLAAAAIHADEALLLRDHNLVGRLLDTFVTAQLRAELAACSSHPRLHHLRTEGGRQEIDLIVELSGGRILAIEVKAAVAVDRGDARHLLWLREALGTAFLHGLVLHTGGRMFGLSERITAAPMSALWS
jgi:hypothetical protein